MTRSWIGSIFLVLAVISTACFGSDGDASSPGTTVAVDATASTTNAPEPDSDEPDPSEETTIADQALGRLP